MKPTIRYHSLVEVSDLVEAFEAGTLPREHWTHHAHLVVALWYLVNFPHEEATAKARCGIRAYNQACGVENTLTSGYHETLTRFWMWVVASFLGEHSAVLPIHELATALLNSAYADRNLPFTYYSKSHLMSVEARMNWAEPDLGQLSVNNDQ
jgi:hypothetical protein